jgi:hypothetical protein
MTGRQGQRHGEGWHGRDAWHEDYSQNHNPAPPTSAASNCSQGGWGGCKDQDQDQDRDGDRDGAHHTQGQDRRQGPNNGNGGGTNDVGMRNKERGPRM